jgi:hypothetical protein
MHLIVAIGRLSRMHDESDSVIKAGSDLVPFIREIQAYCDAGMVADIDLIDGTSTTGVLIGVSSTALILDRWDGQAHRPAGDPFTLALELVAKVVIA